MLESAISHHAATASHKLREDGSLARLVGVGIRSDRFKLQDAQYRGWLVLPLPQATDDLLAITHTALTALRQLYRPEIGYKKATVMLLELQPAASHQPDLFEPPADPRRRQLMQVMDRIKRRYGHDALRLASELHSDDWLMRQALCSPRLTTSWDELPLVS